MAKETVTIKKDTMNSVETVLDDFAMLLMSELDSSVNDKSVKEALRKSLKRVEKLEVEINKQIRLQ
jgi:hypothetical protein